MSENLSQEIGFAEFFHFTKKYRKGLLWFGFVSTVITLFLIAACFVFLPKNVSYSSQIVLQLRRSGSNFIYPSGKLFSANDIISIPVLRRIYDEHKLNGRIKFEAFCELFSLGGTNIEKEMQAALFRSKLSKKNLTIVEIKAIEEEYAEVMRTFDRGSIGLAMVADHRFSREEAEKILRKVPIVWFNIYSKLEAKEVLNIATRAQILDLRKKSDGDGLLISLDKARDLCDNLSQGCQNLQEMLKEQKVSLPSGEYLDDLITQLEWLKKHRILPTMLLIRQSPDFENSMNKVFLKSLILMLDRQILVCKEKYEGVLSAVSVLHPEAAGAADRKSVVSDKDSSAPVTLNLDGSFFASVSALISSSQNIEQRERYAARIQHLKGEIAELEAEKKYYQTIENGMLLDKKSNTVLSQAEFKKLTKVMYEELLEICAKVNSFKELVLQDYVSSRTFFVTSGEVLEMIVAVLPFLKIAAGLIFLLILVNAVNFAVKFYTACSKNELSN